MQVVFGHQPIKCKGFRGWNSLYTWSQHVIMLMFVNHNHRFAGKRTEGSGDSDMQTSLEQLYNRNIRVNSKGNRFSKYG